MSQRACLFDLQERRKANEEAATPGRNDLLPHSQREEVLELQGVQLTRQHKEDRQHQRRVDVRVSTESTHESFAAEEQ